MSRSNIKFILKRKNPVIYFREVTESLRKIITGDYATELPLEKIQTLLNRPRPLTYAWFAMEDLLFKERYKHGLRLLKIGLLFNFLSVSIILLKNNTQIEFSILFSIIQITFSLLGLLLVLTSFFESKITFDSEKSALEYIASVSPAIHQKIISDTTRIINSSIQNHHYGKNISMSREVKELILEIAGLYAIGGLPKIKASWLTEDDDLLTYCGLEEFLSKQQFTKREVETYLVIKEGFLGNLEELIMVVKKI